MSTMREEFEAVISTPPFEHMCDRNSAASAWPGQYKRYETQLAWEIWQAASNAMKERCATEVKSVLDDQWSDTKEWDAAYSCLESVRAINTEE